LLPESDEINLKMSNSSALKKLIKPVKSLVRSVVDKIPLTIEARPLRHDLPARTERFYYQQHHVTFDIRPDDLVIDIGSGGDPFPYATHLIDRFLEPTEHRHGPLVNRDKPLIAADVHNLPFRDKSFDFVYCAHILEHVDDPITACAEIMRIGKRGYLETPTMGEDILFAFTAHIHKWHVVAIARTLCFFEYSERQSQGIRSNAWADVIESRRHHPLQDAFYQNQDIFKVMFTWEDNFQVFVFRSNGTIESLNAETLRRDDAPFALAYADR